MASYNQIDDFLSGKKISTGAYIKYEFENKYLSMLDYISDILKGKKILHFGACDHLEVVEKKVKSGQYLHKIISDLSEICLGVDINLSLIEKLKQKYMIDNIIFFDLINDPLPDEIKTRKWDYICLFDIIEHIDNPVFFLSELHKKFYGIVDKILISVPNAFRFDNFMISFKNIEFINTDHRYWFTPYTISKVVYQSGFLPDKIFTLQRGGITKKNLLKRILIKKFDFFRDTLIIEAKFNE